jgi:hypothetical protein
MDNSPRDATSGPAEDSAEDDRLRRLEALRRLAQEQTRHAEPTEPRPPRRTESHEARPPEPHPRRAREPGARPKVTRRPPAGTRRGRWVALGLVLVAAAIVVGVFLHTRPTWRPPIARHPLPLIQPLVDGIVCVADAAFSPDARSIAVVGYSTRCPHSTFDTGYTPGNVVVYTVNDQSARRPIPPRHVHRQRLAHRPQCGRTGGNAECHHGSRY